MAQQLELVFSQPARTLSDRRVFLGWERAALPAAVAHLLTLAPAHDRVVDLQGVLVSVPSARAGRRLLALLVAASEDTHRGLLPPRIVTLGALPEQLYVPALRLASEEESMLAWLDALNASPQSRDILHAEPSLLLARVARRLQSALAAERRSFADAAQACADQDAPRMQARHAAWAAIELRQRARLAEWQCQDVFAAREQAIQSGALRSPQQIVLLGAPEIPGQTLAMLQVLETQLTVLVFAPAAMAARFDAFGRVRVAEWAQARINLEDSQLAFVDTAREQASAARDAIAGLADAYTLDEVAIGVLDDEITAPIGETLASEGIATHEAAPLRFAHTSLARLLAASAAVLSDMAIEAFAAWVRHPDIAAALSLRPRELEALDHYRFVHLPQRFAPPFMREASAADIAGISVADTRHAPILQSLHERALALLAPLQEPVADLAQCARAALAFTSRVFAHRPLVREHPGDGVLLTGLELILALALRVQDMAKRPCNMREGLQILADFLAEEDIARPNSAPAIDLLGWLELLLDDAPVLCVLGMNDGFVPQAQNADAFLPNGLRERLGLSSNDTRHARDVYVLCSLVATRQKLFMTVGRRSLVGDPHVPSRLLFACEPERQAQRLRRFIHDRGREPGLHHEGSALLPPKPQAPFPRVERLPVSAFADYLACPYRFYLARVLRLDECTDAASGEIDPLSFGNITHAILQAFGESSEKDSTDGKAITAWLHAALARAVAIAYGSPPPPTVTLQVAQLEKRLAAFARWQAARRAKGFVIESTELVFKDVPFMVDGEPMQLSGRIDRVDRHQRDGQVVLIDYKVGEREKDPEDAHRNGETWIDLQLPLYRYLYRQHADKHGIAVPSMALAYVSLAADTAEVEESLVSWGPEVFKAAEACAADVVRKIRENKYWPPNPEPPFRFARLSVICQDGADVPVVAE